MSAERGPRDTDRHSDPTAIDDVLSIELTTCAEVGCGLPAEVTERFVLESTDRPVEHVATRCVARHHLRMPSSMLLGADR